MFDLIEHFVNAHLFIILESLIRIPPALLRSSQFLQELPATYMLSKKSNKPLGGPSSFCSTILGLEVEECLLTEDFLVARFRFPRTCACMCMYVSPTPYRNKSL